MNSALGFQFYKRFFAEEEIILFLPQEMKNIKYALIAKVDPRPAKVAGGDISLRILNPHYFLSKSASLIDADRIRPC